MGYTPSYVCSKKASRAPLSRGTRDAMFQGFARLLQHVLF